MNPSIHEDIRQNWDILRLIYQNNLDKLQIILIQGHSVDIFNNRADYLSKYSRRYYQNIPEHILPLDLQIHTPLLISPPLFDLYHIFKIDNIHSISHIDSYLEMIINHIESHIQHSLKLRNA